MPFQLPLLKNRYPESERSAGDFISKAGDKNCYDAKGPVREMFINAGLEASIRNLLNNQTTELYAGEQTHEILKYGIFMIGKTPLKSHPTIMLCCQAENPRKRAKKMILKEKILDNYPGVKLRTCDDSTLLFASHDMEVSSAPEDAKDRSQILCRRSRLTEDRRIFIKTHNEHSTLRKASCGKVLQINGEYFYSTVSHAFTSSIIPTELQTTKESNYNRHDFGLCLDSDSDTDEDDFINDIEEEEENDDDVIDATSLGSLTPGYADSETNSDTESDTFLQSEVFDCQDDGIEVINSSSIFSEDQINNACYEKITPNQVLNHHYGASDKHLRNPTPRRQSAEDEKLSVLGEQHLSSQNGPNPNLDYTLIKVSENEADRMNGQEIDTIFKVTLDRDQSWVVQEPTRIDVTAITGSGSVLSGKLLGTPTFMMFPGSTVFQEVWTMQHNGTLLDGDCGSWVFSAKDGKLVGHIIAGSLGTSLAYMIPFRYIFADIIERFGREISLTNKPSSSTVQNLYDDSCHIENFNDWLLSSSDPKDSLDEGEVEDEISLNGNKLHNNQGQGAAQWLLEIPQYQVWLNECPGHLWIRGHPGRGKTTLMSSCLRQIPESSHSGQNLIFVFSPLPITFNLQELIIDDPYSCIQNLLNFGKSSTHRQSGGIGDSWSTRTYLAYQKIHQAESSTDQGLLLAVEQLRTQELNKFNKEHDILSDSDIAGHKHLARLPTIYQKDSDFHLHFACLKADLRSYWAQTTSSYWNPTTCSLVFDDIHCIISSLDIIHGSNGGGPLSNVPDKQRDVPELCSHHGNVKPENIFYLNNIGGAFKEGMLQVDGIGLSHFHRVHSRLLYVPPDLGPGPDISRAWDDWTVPCVFHFPRFMNLVIKEPQKFGTSSNALEMMELEPTFKNNRFYLLITDPRGNTTSKVKLGVSWWIDELQRSERCSQAITELFYLVRNTMPFLNAEQWIGIKLSNAELKRLLEKSRNDERCLIV